MKRLSFLFCSLLVSTAAHAVSWADLWLTKEQQAQRLLEAGKPADAADKFQDARRRAYAQIKAGQYDEAAKRLEGFEDPQSQYNRGNALARSGKLEDALAAYDEAIKQTSADSTLGRDARHNRELVAKQLENQQQASQSGSEGQSQPRDQSHSDQSQSGQSQSGRSQSGDQSPSGDRNDQRNAGNQGDRNMQSQDGEQYAAAGSQQQNQDQGQQGKDSQGESPGERQAQAEQPQGAQDDSAISEAEKAKQDAADARRDAEAALAQANRNDPARRNESPSGRMAQPGERPADEQGKPVAGNEPPSEQTLALDQWLRQIPDDPGGLLRRKFLIEHLKRQQESRQ